MGWSSLLLTVALACGIYSAPTKYILHGVADGYTSNATLLIDKWSGVNLSSCQIYDTFCGNWIFEYFPNRWAAGNVPMSTLQPTLLDCKNNAGNNTAEMIARGEQDAYLLTKFNITKTWLAGPNGIYGDSDDRRLYLRFAHEMNGNWYPWSGNATAYVLAWQRAWGIAAKLGITNTRMQWVWCPSAQDVGGIKAEEYWPGAQYVDWIGIDGYNNANYNTWSTWQTAEQVFGNMLSRVIALAPTKPLSINEVGCSTYGYTTQDKAAWVTQFYDYCLTNGIKYVLWLNEEYIYTDYAVFASRNGTDTWVNNNQTYLVYNTYKQALQNTSLPLAPNNPRILTDDQFIGNF